MPRQAPAGPWHAETEAGLVRWLVCRLAVAFVVALAFSPAIRGVTAALTQTVGTRWPFVLEHCRAVDTPGCRFAEPGPLLRRLATR